MDDDRRPDRPIPRVLVPLRRLERARRGALHRLRLRGRLVADPSVNFGPAASLKPPRQLTIGRNVNIGAQWHVECDAVIGDDVLISSQVSFVSDDHAFDDPTQTVFTQGRRRASPPVVLEGDNLIGFGSTVLGGVRIGRGAIVGARSLVTSDLPPYTVCYGVPARPRRPRYPNSDRRETGG